MTAQFPTQRLNTQRIWFATFLAVAFAAGVLVSSLVAAGISHPDPVASGGVSANGASDPRSNEYAVYRATATSLAAAVARHDWATAAQYRVQLDSQMTRATVAAVYADHARLLSNLDAARVRGDRKLYEEFRLQLAELCPAISAHSDPGFCKLTPRD
jgi:hypothetical protein